MEVLSVSLYIRVSSQIYKTYEKVYIKLTQYLLTGTKHFRFTSTKALQFTKYQDYSFHYYQITCV